MKLTNIVDKVALVGSTQSTRRSVTPSTNPRSQCATPKSHHMAAKPLQPRSLVQSSASSNQASTSYAESVNSSEVKAVLFDMDGVLCNSEIVSRKAAAEVMKVLYNLDVDPAEFEPFTGTGEANFLGGVAKKYNAPFEVESCKAKFFEIYLEKYAVPGAGIGCEGARALVEACRAAGLKVAVASSADRVKVDANLGAADIPLTLFDTIVTADAFEKLKPFPDIFLAAASQLGIPPENCVVIEDAVAGVQAARAAGMRVIGVTTTLPEAALAEVGPDKIEPAIKFVALDDIRSLKLRQGAFDGVTITKPNKSSDSNSNNLPSTSYNNTSSSSMSWLNETVNLPAGYKTTRRDALKFLSLGGAFGSFYVVLTRAKSDARVRDILRTYHIPTLIQLGIIAYLLSSWQYLTKSLSYASPKAILNLLLPPPPPPSTDNLITSDSRIASFKRFIADLEQRGGGQKIPEFPSNSDWLNAPPLRLSRELQGKVVILDFWTYCCINCMHVLPQLALIERKYANQPVAVVGVHSAKFENEQLTDAIRNAVLRYDIQHPVVNDQKMSVWRDLGVSSWPTLAIVSPQGKLIAMLAGEGHKQDVDDIVAAALEYYGEENLLDNRPVPVDLEKNKSTVLKASPLRFPGKLALDTTNNRMFISDSGNHRIVVTDLAGMFIEHIGGNGAGLLDGKYEVAQFNRPQGLAYEKNTLYVADTESHALRAVDLTSKQVKTLAGDGKKGGDYQGGKQGTLQQLNSPWDVAVNPNDPQTVYIALAGQHQIWRHNLATSITSVFSGSGYERNQNGDSPLSTAWAQPSGLAFSPDNSFMYVADSESSSIRKLRIKDGGSEACVGGDALFADNLFKFGDKDGPGSDALLQHPLAVAVDSVNNRVYVADSYNHKLKVLDGGLCAITTVAGSGVPGYKDGSISSTNDGPKFSEPGGLAVGSDGLVYIADTNNSLIRVYSPQTQKVSTLELKKVPPPRINPDVAKVGSSSTAEDDQDDAGATVVRADKAITGESGEVRVNILLPPKYHLTAGAGSGYSVSSNTATGIKVEPSKGLLVEGKGVASAVLKYSRDTTAEGNDGEQQAMVKIATKVYFCQDNDVCLFEEVVFKVPVSAERSSTSDKNVVELQYQVSAQAPSVDFPLM